MMREIYASAAQVTIWLGESDENSDCAFDAMPVVADKRSWFWQQHQEQDSGRRSDILKYCGDFFFTLVSSRPWFSRVWILQELAVSKSDPVVVCGEKRILWSSLVMAWQAIVESKTFGLVSFLKEHQVPDGKSEFLLQTKLNVLDNLRKFTQDTGASLRKLLLISRASAATDPRDRIYGLLGLLEQDAVESNNSVVITVDYRKSCAEVYADAMAHIFSRGDGPYFLSGIFLSGSPVAAPHISSLPESIEQPDLPSWAPDFSRQTFDTARQPTGMSFLPPSTMSVSGAGHGAKNGRVLKDGRTLQVKGLIHMKSGYEPAPASYEQTYLNYLSAASIDDKLSKHIDDAQKPEYEILLRACIGRKSFFTTQSGFAGTCIPATHKGDTIAIIFGSPAPFVLRPIASIEGKEPAYTLVGTCYLGGIMNGEMVDELYCEDLMESTTFLVR
ncbi:hypothetical protein CC86DRAFT_280695 [Ophiobolus disseminans]|uniref:Heterokaryon incompatibility domain-containing protein n=1 Tax=Ophiobolus disseminans TaxID=1469910 RepID=A0A6A7AH32_9PLEO|nr:hypothetical protein CC86DRAFT_280695 [Ophiobolus disseminans]